MFFSISGHRGCSRRFSTTAQPPELEVLAELRVVFGIKTSLSAIIYDDYALAIAAAAAVKNAVRSLAVKSARPRSLYYTSVAGLGCRENSDQLLLLLPTLP